MVEAALLDCNENVERISGDLFPIQSTLNVQLSSGEQTLIGISQAGKTIDLSRFDRIWRRRGENVQIDLGKVHPDDRAFVNAEAEAAAQGWRELSALSASKWINPVAEGQRAGNKPYQLGKAIEMGLRVPKTLISNTPQEIRDFYNDCNGGVIYKPLTPGVWQENDEILANFVDILPKEDLEDDDVLMMSPGIYQEYTKKAYELRVTILDNFVHAVKIPSQSLVETTRDWRQRIEFLELEPYELPAVIRHSFVALIRSLGLRFGAADFIVTPQGEYVFLEVNQMGQFLWIDKLLPEAKLLAHFCAFLTCTENYYSGASETFDHLNFVDYE